MHLGCGARQKEQLSKKFLMDMAESSEAALKHACFCAMRDDYFANKRARHDKQQKEQLSKKFLKEILEFNWIKLTSFRKDLILQLLQCPI